MRQLKSSKILGTTKTGLLAILQYSILTNLVLALEPTPPSPSDQPPQVVQQAPVMLRQIIIKYRNDKANIAVSADGKARAEEITVFLRSQFVEKSNNNLPNLGMKFVGEMSGNAGVYEIDGLEGAKSVNMAETIQSIAERISELPDIEYANPNQLDSIQQVNDPRFYEQWHYTDNRTGVNIVPAWKVTTGKDVRVAVIDTGYRPHEDLAGSLLPGYDFISNLGIANDGDGPDADASDPGDWVSNNDFWCPSAPRNSSWHGTHVAGTIAALTNNKIGGAGISFNTKIIPVRVLGKCGGSRQDIANGIRWAAGLPVPNTPNNPNPAHVINLSLGGPSTSCPAVYQQAINDAVNAGTTIVVAAGNSDSDAGSFAPANCANVITVASTNRDGDRAYYSNRGASVELAAPGGETYSNRSDGVLSTLNDGATIPGKDIYAFYQGTSMAAPHVAGVAALLYSLDTTITPAKVLKNLQASAKPFPTGGARPCNVSTCGAGIVDAFSVVTSKYNISTNAQITSIQNLLKPGEVKSAWVGVDSEGNEYSQYMDQKVSEPWFEGSPGSGDTQESTESEGEYEKLVSLPSLSHPGVEIGPLRIIGPDDRKIVMNTTRYPASAQVLVALPGGRCSGALIGPDLVLTAGHCVHGGGSSGTWQSNAVIFPGRNGRQAPFGSCRATRFYSVLGWTRDKNPAYDFGAIKLNCDVGKRAGWMGFFWQSDSLVGKGAIISSYPEDKPLEQWGHADKVRNNSALQTFYQTDTVGGNSGSGVYATSGVPQGCAGPCVHTAHAYGGTSLNSGTRITEPLFNNLIRWQSEPK